MNISRTFHRIGRGCLLPVALLSLTPVSGTAQTLTQDWLGPSNVSLELNRPFFADRTDFTAFTGLGYLSGMFGSGRTRFLVELPFARGGIDSEGFSSSSSMIGSPFVGVALTPTNGERGVSGSVGVRIPVPEGFVFGEDDFAPAIGVTGDPDRLEAFLTETVTLSGALRFERPVGETVTIRGQVDGDLLIFTDSGGGDSTEAFLGWGGLVRWDGDAAFALGQLTGRYLATEDVDDRVWHQLQGQGGWTFGSVQPWIGVRVPVQGDLTEDVDWTLLLGVQVRLGS
jgi:hypothetical protein